MSKMREAAQEEIRTAEQQIATLTGQIQELKSTIKRGQKVLKLYASVPAAPAPAVQIARVS